MNLQTLKFYWQHARNYWGLLLLSAGGVIITIGLDLGSPLVYKHFFNLLVSGINERSNPAVMHGLYWNIAIILAVSGFAGASRYAYGYATSKLESHTMADLSNTCFAYLHRHSYQFFADSFSGGLVKRINRFAAGFETVADQIILQFGQTVIRATLIIGILFWQNTKLALVFTVWTALFITYTVVDTLRRQPLDKKRAKMDTTITAQLSDTISNNINLKVFAGIDYETEEFRSLTEEHRQSRYAVWKWATRSERIQQLAVRVLEGVILVMSVKLWRDGTLTLGDFVLLRSYLYQLVDNVQNVGQSIRRISEAMTDANEMTEVLITPHEIVDAKPTAELSISTGVIELRNVQFAYGSKKPVLREFNLLTEAGERVGVVGPSGGGKSTVLKLISRLYDVQHGNVLIDGQDVSRVTQDSLHRSIAYVPQDPVLFHRTLMENIRYSRRDATDAEVIDAATLAHCHEFISRSPDGYQTMVGERGIKLSGGERQRVAIARAILMDAPVLLLDEATSSLDSESEMYIQDSLSKLMKGRTVIAVAHRLSTVRKMDRIVVVQGGRIVEEGSHDLLLKVEDGIYQKLWGLQTVEHFDLSTSNTKASSIN